MLSPKTSYCAPSQLLFMFDPRIENWCHCHRKRLHVWLQLKCLCCSFCHKRESGFCFLQSSSILFLPIIDTESTKSKTVCVCEWVVWQVILLLSLVGRVQYLCLAHKLTHRAATVNAKGWNLLVEGNSISQHSDVEWLKFSGGEKIQSLQRIKNLILVWRAVVTLWPQSIESEMRLTGHVMSVTSEWTTASVVWAWL